MRDLIDCFIATTNALDFEGTVVLFADDAYIDDVSVGDAFVGKDGIRTYLKRFFAAYHTVSRLLSIETTGEHRALARVDFTGDFGHEIGVLAITVNSDGLI
jgi:ketosteroid isomerase-like protein